MTKYTSILTGAALSMTLAGTAMAESWDMPTPYSDKTFHTVNIAEFAKDVEAATNGKMKIKVHSGASLFKHAEISKAVRGGQVPIGEFFMGLLANENPAYGIDTLPFLATDYKDAEKLWAAQRPAVEELMAKQGLTILFSVPWPPQGLYTKKEIKSVADLKGLKFRSYNATLEKFVKAAGAAPTQVAAHDIAQAFSTGRVEAMITSPSTGANSKAWDFVTHYTDIQAWIPKNVVAVNTKAFRKLDDVTKAAIMKAAQAAEARGWEMSKTETATKTKILKDNGMIIVTPSNELMTGLRAIGTTMLSDWKKDAGNAGAAIIKNYTK